MCGRYLQTRSAEKVSAFFRAEVVHALRPRYNIAPTQPVPVVRAGPDGRRRVELVMWGLVPGWAKDPKIGSRLINARSETAATSGAFRAAMKYRRCVLPADGFYEWQQPRGAGSVGGKGSGGRKRPYLVRMASEEPFGFAGLWERWQDAAGNELDSCAILTTEPNEMMAPIHNRMPVILRPEDYERWLDPGLVDASAVQPLLRPFPAEEMLATPVTSYVSDPRHEGERCVASPADEQGRLFG